jgi:transposase
LRKDPFTGTVFVFRSRKADRLKLLCNHPIVAAF